MDAGEQVRCGIGLIQESAQHREKVMVRKINGAQVMPVGVNCGNDQKYGHSGKQKRAEPVIFALIAQRKISDPPGNICKPQQVRDDKIFTKRNQIIQGCMNNMKMGSNGFLHVPKPSQIHKKIQQQQQMPVLFEELAKSFPPCSHDFPPIQKNPSHFVAYYSTINFKIQFLFLFLH
jgi:hypothetical protein